MIFLRNVEKLAISNLLKKYHFFEIDKFQHSTIEKNYLKKAPISLSNEKAMKKLSKIQHPIKIPINPSINFNSPQFN
jgi:hypothetical protein